MRVVAGRKVIYTDEEVITRENVVAQVNTAMLTHLKNREDIQYLDDFLRGNQDIQAKTKEYREEINHKITENRAYQVHSFYAGYAFGENTQYIRRERVTGSSDETDFDEISEKITILNSYMVDCNKEACDKDMSDWLLTCGVGYRLTLPNDDRQGLSPFKVYSLDPRNTFVVYYKGYDHHPVFSVSYMTKTDGEMIFSVYTDDKYFEYNVPSTFSEVTGAPIGVKEERHIVGTNPIIEYDLNNQRMGIFEPALPILNAINELQSNRMDDIVQYVDSILTILGGDISEETYNKMLQFKMLALPDGTDAKYIGKALSENDVQNLKQDLLTALYEICGLPNRSGGSGRSTSDTGAASQIRDGWEDAEQRTKSIVAMFKRSEREFLKMVLDLMNRMRQIDLNVQDVDVHFTRRNYENIVSKAQVLTQMLDNGKIDPQLAFEASGMFVDPESAYLQSKKYVEEVSAREATNNGTGGDQVPNMPQKTDESGRPVSGQVSTV